MRRFRRHRGGLDGDDAQIDMAPLIDMVFLLLIFTLVTASFVRDSGVTVQRPEHSAARATREAYLPVAIARDGSVWVDGRRLPGGEVAAIGGALRAAGVDRVLVQADRSVPTGLLLEVMDRCQQAGARQVDVAAEVRR